MKRIIYLSIVICIFILIILTIYKVDASIISFPLAGKTIYLDAGHGGPDNGASSGKILEKDINLEIVYKLEKELTKNGAKVLLTRTDENDLSKPNSKYRKKSDFDNRIKLINNSKADIYISIHQNYFYNNMYYGPQVFYVKNNEELATTIQKDLNKLSNTNRKAKIIRNTYMYDKLIKPGVLIECGFLSNQKEKNKLISDTYQQELAKTISESIIKFYLKK